jgi:hypothetical protein
LGNLLTNHYQQYIPLSALPAGNNKDVNSGWFSIGFRGLKSDVVVLQLGEFSLQAWFSSLPV